MHRRGCCGYIGRFAVICRMAKAAFAGSVRDVADDAVILCRGLIRLTKKASDATEWSERDPGHAPCGRQPEGKHDGRQRTRVTIDRLLLCDSETRRFVAVSRNRSAPRAYRFQTA